MPNQLYHHGIQGQKWGQRNGPPYPLSRSVHVRIVKKTQLQKDIDKGYKKRNRAFARGDTAFETSLKVKTKDEQLKSSAEKLRELSYQTRQIYENCKEPTFEEYKAAIKKSQDEYYRVAEGEIRRIADGWGSEKLNRKTEASYQDVILNMFENDSFSDYLNSWEPHKLEEKYAYTTMSDKQARRWLEDREFDRHHVPKSQREYGWL